MQTNLGEAIKHYLEWKSTHTTRAFINYRPWLLRFADSMPAKVVEDITLNDIVKFRLWMDNKFQPYTIQLAMVAVHNFLKWCNLMKYDTIPSGLVKIQRTDPRPRPVVYKADYDKFVAYFEGRQDFLSIRNYLIIRLLWDTGVRISELCDLNIDTMNLQKREANIRTRKNQKIRQIFWSIETNIILTAYIKKRVSIGPTPSLFIGFGPGPLSDRLKPRAIQRIVKELAEEVLGRPLSPHSFRHGKAHRILDLGGNPKHIQDILGHSNPIASFHYTQWNNEERSSAARRFLEEGVYSEKQTGEEKPNVAKTT